MAGTFGSGAADFDEDDENDEADVESEQPEQHTQTASEGELEEPTSEDEQREPESTGGSSEGIEQFSDLDVTDYRSPEQLARILMAEEYHQEDPGVPYAMWRKGTSTGRTRTSIELNRNVDALVRAARQEFENRYDATINIADLREMAMVVGLMNPDDVFAMAEEWGLEYNK